MKIFNSELKIAVMQLRIKKKSSSDWGTMKKQLHLRNHMNIEKGPNAKGNNDKDTRHRNRTHTHIQGSC